MPYRILQLSDTHLYGDTDATLYEVSPYDGLRAVIDDIAQRNLPADLVLLSGDLVHDESDAGYAGLVASLRPLGVPQYALPGNHDAPALLERYWPGHAATHETLRVFCDRWQVLLVNSAVPGEVAGRVSGTDLARLEGFLQADPERFTLVCLHHHPIPVGGWIDRIGLTNGAELLDMLAGYENVRGVVFGHIHGAFHGRYRHLHCYGAPSTCVQFKPQADVFTVDTAPPGYRYLELYPDGRLATQVYWAKRD